LSTPPKIMIRRRVLHLRVGCTFVGCRRCVWLRLLCRWVHRKLVCYFEHKSVLDRLGFLRLSLSRRWLLRCGRLLGRFSMSSLLLRGLRCFLLNRELIRLRFGCQCMVAPRFTSSMAYSTWKSRPSGEKTVIARSYAPGAANTDIMLTSLYSIHFFTVHIITILKTFPIKAKHLR
jgi:hypothetical protein